MIFTNKKITTYSILAVATAMAFYGFYGSRDRGIIEENITTEPDTIIHFSFSEEQRNLLETKFSNLSQYQGFNGVALVGQRDSIFYGESFGYADYKSKDSLNLNSSFQLASVSKQFTAVAILQLYQKGLLNLTDSVTKFYPEFPYKGVTIHQLLVHRSGLPNYHYFLQHIPTTYDTLINNQDVVREMLTKNPEPYYSPNRRYHYSNTGYAILAALVEHVSGQSFEDYLEQNIFQPLEMTSSYAYRGKLYARQEPNTQGYLYGWRPAEDNYLDGVLGDKGIYCSPSDLFKWDQGLYSNVIINSDTLALAFEPMGKPKYFRSNYGYGWRMYYWGDDSVKVLYHAGWWHGYKNLLIRIPQDTVTVMVLKNRSSGAQVSTRSLMQILYPNEIPETDTLINDTTQVENDIAMRKTDNKEVVF